MSAKGIIQKRCELWKKYKDIERDKEFVEAVGDYLVNERGTEIRKEIQERPELLIEMIFIIVDKEQNTIPFFINTVQKKFLNILNQAIKDFKIGKRKSIAFLILKGRQQGFTSIITAYQLACSITQKNFAGYTLADEKDNTEAIFSDKAKFPYDNLPEQIKPTEKYNNRRELHFAKINSRWRVATAGNKNAGRSKTLNFFHGSEAAFFADLKKTLTGLKPALVKSCIRILETTANGINQFTDLWEEENSWEGLFFEWWETPEYREEFINKQQEKEFKAEVKEAKPYSDASNRKWVLHRCKWLIEEIHLTWEQVYWYYLQWKDFRRDIMQEYPCTADEAFLASGLCVFDKEKIILRKAVLKRQYEKNPPKVGYFTFKWNDEKSKDRILDNSIKFVEDEAGYIKIYEDKKKGYPYVVGGDTKGEGSDFFAGTVINNVSGKRCATLHGYLAPDQYAHQIYCMGIYFNIALISIEINFDLYPVKELERLHYPKQYMRQKYDDITGKYELKQGFKTDGNTRPVIISREVVLIRDNIDLFMNIEFLNECLTFVDKDGRADAEDGKHDDILFSDMIGEDARGQQTVSIDFTMDVDLSHLSDSLREDLENDPEALQHYLRENGLI